MNIMDKDITIVTAFFDIGRGDWKPEDGFPHYLQRTTDTYFERFATLAKLENEMVVFCQREHFDRVQELRGDRPTTIFEFDLASEAQDLRDQIELVYAIPDYQRMINPRERTNPEYWCADYVIINLLKSTFACMASVQAQNEMIAWVDFGYCRTPEAVGDLKHWYYPFDKDKIHLWSIRDHRGEDIPEIISNNMVFVTGPCIVASKTKWKLLEHLVMEAVQGLLANHLIDDDQLFLLLAALSSPDDFTIRKLDPNDWFTVIKDYHEVVPA